MRLVGTPSTFCALLFTSLSLAHPYPRDDLQDAGYGFIKPRNCASYCGVDNQYCCAEGEQCYTSAGIAGCAGAGGWEFFTTTWTETRTYTSTMSSHLPAVTQGPGASEGPCVPPPGSGQIACGPICCASWQYCADDVEGQCMANGASWTEWTTIGVITTQFSAPYRVTSGSTIFATSTTGEAGEATETSTGSPGATPVESTDGGLAPGAIAGIVIGTIAGVALLLLCCFCCIVKGLWDAFVGILGGGKKKKRSKEHIEVIEERYSRHGRGQSQHRTWFGGGGGGGGGRPSGAGARKEKKSGSGLGWVAAGAGALALLLGLKRDERRKAHSHKPPRSDWSSSYYTDSYTASSPSEFIPIDRLRWA
ncbi:hypothetical protein DL767_002656 [Monosporascus sp. MG133]|nr:hypothetical protein DL767_002656 [Monosporascus sp. MG133]